jgi:hypothetical protein
VRGHNSDGRYFNQEVRFILAARKTPPFRAGM